MSTERRTVGQGPLVRAVFVAYAVGLALLVFAPLGWSLNRMTVRLYFFFRSDMPIAPDGIGPEHYGALLNVLLFVPLGAVLALLISRPWWWVVLPAAVVSSVIELVQGRWLDRVSSWSDLVANTVGALLGAAAVSLLARARRRSASRPGPGRPR